MGCRIQFPGFVLFFPLSNFRFSSSGYSARRLKKGEHYEDVQKELLENEIRIQTRRARYKHQNNDHQRNYRGSSGPAGGGYHRSDRGGRSSWIIAKGGSSRSSYQHDHRR